VILDHPQSVLGHDRHTILGLGVALLRARCQQPCRRAEMLGLECSDTAAEIHIQAFFFVHRYVLLLCFTPAGR
jgi:hypothetical protein